MKVSTLPLLVHQQASRDVELPYGNYHAILKARAEEAPDRDFLIFPESGRKYTYREFYQVSLNAAAWIGAKSPDFATTCIIFRNTPEFLAVFFGAMAHGITAVPINPDLAVPEIQFIIENSGGATVFYDAEMKEKLEPLVAKLSNGAFYPLADVAELPQMDGSAVEAALPEVSPIAPAAIIYTSGTTGFPKGVVLSHMNFLVDGMGIAEWFQFSPETRSLCIMPLFHNNGLVISLTTTLHGGGSIVMVDPKASLRSFWFLVERYGATFTSVMPSILAAILAFGFDGRPGMLKGIICGGQLLPLDLALKFEHRFGIPIFEGFGSTEATSYSSFNGYPAERRKLGSVGTVLPISDMKVVDDDDNEVAEGTEGEICIRGANVAIGYHNLPELQTHRFRNGWYHSGDFGRQEHDGHFYFRSRKDDLIVKGGEKIYPAEIENVLASHANVTESAVIGVDDAILGQEICAFVHLKNASTTTEGELLKFCAQSLARFKQPKRIVIINRLEDMPELPKGPTKKILYRVLREYYEGRLSNSEDTEGLKWALGTQGAG